jgi:N-acetylmuramoyl-L-alanine amidase
MLPASAPPPPPIVRQYIPFGATRKREMSAYSRRHYGTPGYRLVAPKVIVEHIAVAGSTGAVRATFAPDRPDSELHELPGTCSHYVVGATGTVVALVPVSIRCRHTVGLNDVAIGIEHVGFRDGDLLSRPAELRASLRLTQYLRCRFAIAVKNVIGHNESLSSPYHHERVARLRTQTHGDMVHASMLRYRAALRRLGPCPPSS